MESKHIKIFSNTTVIVGGLRSLLEDNGIHSITKDQTESGRLAGFGAPINAIELFILEEDLEKAKPIIEEFKRSIEA